MISLDMTDDDLRLEYWNARRLAELCRSHGETGPTSHYDALARACEAEAKGREIDL